MKKVACLGDQSTHGGSLITSNQSGKFTTKGVPVCANGAMHYCPMYYGPGAPHGTTPVTAITIRSYVEGKLILTEGAIAGCGAIIMPTDRQHYVE